MSVLPLVPSHDSSEFLSSVRHQATVAQRYMYDLSHVNRSHLARRPFFVFWFMGQVSRYVQPFIFSQSFLKYMPHTHRALTLWECDNTLTVALDVCKAFLSPIEYLTALWPCTGMFTCLLSVGIPVYLHVFQNNEPVTTIFAIGCLVPA